MLFLFASPSSFSLENAVFYTRNLGTFRMKLEPTKEGFFSTCVTHSVGGNFCSDPRLVFLTYAVAVRCEDVGVVNALAGSVMGCFLAKISWGKWGGCWLETQYRVYC